MIQLATDPTASRTNWRPAPAEEKGVSLEPRRARAAHAWPFISRYADKPARQDTPQTPTSSDHGS
jgi:hypothetical protein